MRVKAMKPKESLPVYPILFAAYPVLSLLGHNIQEVFLRTGLRPLIFIVGGAVILWFILWLLTRSLQKSALLTLLLIILFFSYGRVYQALRQIEMSGFILGRHRYLLPLWAALGGLGGWLIFKRVQDNKNLTILLNMFAVFLLIIPLYQIVEYELRASRAQNAAIESVSSQLPAGTALNPESLPDVYVILMDAHLRTDVLQETFNLDNQDFIDALTGMGFYVPACSMSNYAYTPLSLSSFFNMQYLQEISPEFQPPNNDRAALYELVRHSSVRSIFDSLGYATYAMVSYQPIAWTDADHYFQTVDLPTQDNGIALSNFDQMLYSGTLARVFFDYSGTSGSINNIPTNYPFADHVRQQWFILNKLQEIASERGPKLVFAHLNIPHAPYVFQPDGTLIPNPPPLPWVTPISWEEYIQYYSWGVQYGDSAILPVLRKILADSDTPPVILLLGDHGADSANRLAVLSAFYLPDKAESTISPNITLVNFFRVVFNEVFGANYEILEDVSYLSTQEDSYNFSVYPETMPGCIP